MASFNDKDTNVLFSNVSVGTALGGKYYNGNNGNFSDAATDGVEPFVNAVEIDWNGAGIANTTVNTTGELLKIINDLYGKVNNIDAHLVTTATILYGDGVLGVGGAKSEYVTPEIIKNASKLKDISVNLTSFNTYNNFYSYFEYPYTDGHSLIIRLPYSENNTPRNMYPTDLQFEVRSSGLTHWKDIGYLNSEQRNDNQIKTYTNGIYSYFVITSYAPPKETYSNYSVGFTINNPNYGTISGPTAIPPTTPSSTSPS